MPTALSLITHVHIQGPDKLGLISAISSKLFDLGANIGDSAFSAINGQADYTAVCHFSEEMDLVTLQHELSSLPPLEDAEIQVTVHDGTLQHMETESITHTLTVSGGDTPGLTARLCEVFEQYNANVVRLNADQVAGNDELHYVLTAAVSIPHDTTKSCLSTIANTAGELGLDFEIIEV